jgi:hypothetical protein
MQAKELSIMLSIMLSMRMLSIRRLGVLAGVVLSIGAASPAADFVPPDQLPPLANQLGAVQADSDSVIMIDSPDWSSPLYVGLVTLDEEPLVTTLNDEQIDANGPVRIATTLVHPGTGETINVNIVQIIQRNIGSPERPMVELEVNQELPFIRSAEVAAAVVGQSVRRPTGYAPEYDPMDLANAVCHVTGDPVLELYVWHVDSTGGQGMGSAIPGTDGGPIRPPVGYGVVVRNVTDPFQQMGTVIIDGGDAGGSPDPPAAPIPPSQITTHRKR